MYDPKLPGANRKEAVPVNEDEQTPGWLSRLRDRRKRDLEARTGGRRPARTPQGGPLVVKKRIELVNKDGKSKGHGKSNHQENQGDKMDKSQGTGNQKGRYDRILRA